MGAVTGTGKCFAVNGLIPQCRVTEGHECSLPWNRDQNERTMCPLKAEGWDRALGGSSARPALPGLLWQREPSLLLRFPTALINDISPLSS